MTLIYKFIKFRIIAIFDKDLLYSRGGGIRVSKPYSNCSTLST